MHAMFLLSQCPAVFAMDPKHQHHNMPVLTSEKMLVKESGDGQLGHGSGEVVDVLYSIQENSCSEVSHQM